MVQISAAELGMIRRLLFGGGFVGIDRTAGGEAPPSNNNLTTFGQTFDITRKGSNANFNVTRYDQRTAGATFCNNKYRSLDSLDTVVTMAQDRISVIDNLAGSARARWRMMLNTLGNTTRVYIDLHATDPMARIITMSLIVAPTTTQLPAGFWTVYHDTVTNLAHVVMNVGGAIRQSPGF